MDQLAFFRVITSFSVAGLAASLGLLIYFNSSKSRANRYFAYFNFCLALWNSSDFVGPVLHELSIDPLLYYRASYLGAIILILNFLDLYRENIPIQHSQNIENTLRRIMTLIATLLTISLPTNLLIEKLNFTPTMQESPGWLYPVFAIYFLFGLIYGTYLLWQRYKSSKGVLKNQMQFFVLSLCLAILGAICAMIIISFLPNFQHAFLVFYLLEGMYISLTTYTILKHRLLNIRIAFRKVFYFVSMGVYSIANSIFYLSAFSPKIKFIGMILFAAGIVPYESLSKKWAGSFFSNAFQYHKILENLSRQILHIHFPEEIKAKVEDIVVQSMKLTKVFLIFEADLENENSWYGPLKTEKKMINTEVPCDQTANQNNYELLQEQRISLMFPIIKNENLLGLFLIGEKKDNECFDAMDIKSFLQITDALSIALNHAFSYQKAELAQLETTAKMNRVNQILHSIPNGIVAVDLVGIMISINAQAEKLFGIRANDWIGKEYWNLWKYAKNKDPVQSCLSLGIPVNQIEVSLSTQQHSQMLVEMSVEFIKAKDGKATGAMITLKDMLQVRSLENKLRKAEHNLQLSNQLKKMALELAHNISNPLQSLMFNFSILDQAFDSSGITQEKWKNFSNLFNQESQRMTLAIQALQKSSEPIKLHLSKISISKLCSEQLKKFNDSIQNKHLKYYGTFEETGEFMGDAHYLQQALLEWWSYVFQYCSEDSEIYFNCNKQDSQIKISWSYLTGKLTLPTDEYRSDEITAMAYTARAEFMGFGLLDAEAILHAHHGTKTVDVKKIQLNPAIYRVETVVILPERN